MSTDQRPDKDAAQQKDARKTYGCGLGCATAIAGLMLAIVGIIVVVTSKKSTEETIIPVTDPEKVYSITEMVLPTYQYNYRFHANLAGHKYYNTTARIDPTRIDTSRSGRRRTRTSKHLAFRVPIIMKAVRVSDGKVLHNYAGFLGDMDQLANVKEQSEALTVYAEESEILPKFETQEPIRFELTIKEDKDYQAKVTDGSFILVKSSPAVAKTVSIGILVVLAGGLLGFSGLVVVGVVMLLYIMKHGKVATPGK